MQVLDLGDGLLHSQLFGGEAGQNVGLGAVGEGNEGIHVAYALLFEQVHVAAVALDDDDIVHALGQLVALLAVAFDELDVHVVGGIARDAYGNATAAHNHDFVDFGFAFACELSYLPDVVGRGGEVGDVAHLYLVVTTWDNGFVYALDGRNVKLAVGCGDFVEFLVQNLGVVVQLHAQDDELAVAQLEPVAGPGVSQGGDYLLGRQLFGIDEFVYPQAVEEGFVLGQQIFVVVDPGQRLLGSQFRGHGASHDVAGLERHDGDKQVGLVHLGLFQGHKGGGVSHNRHQVVVGVEFS